MKYWKTALSIFVLSASLALAEDFKTVRGKIYKDATISHVEADGIVVRTKTGISKIYFVELPKDVQQRFHYGSPAAAAVATATAKAATQHVNETQRVTQGDPAGDFADKFAQRVQTKLDEREAILHGKHTPGPAELMALREINFHKAFLAGIAIIACVLFAIVWRAYK